MKVQLVVGLWLFLSMPQGRSFAPPLVSLKSKSTALPVAQVDDTSNSNQNSLQQKKAPRDGTRNDNDAIEVTIKTDGTDTTRRQALTAGTVSMLLAPLLQQLGPEVGRNGASINTNTFVPLSEAVLQGDAIIRNLWLQRLAYPVLIVSLELGLFETLHKHKRPMSKDQLGPRLTPPLQGDGRVLEALVAVLASLGLLHVQQEDEGNTTTVTLTEAARHTLVSDSPFYWGPQLLAADGMTGSLRQAVRRDGRANAVKDYATHSPAVVDSFIDSMQAHGAVTAVATAQALAPILTTGTSVTHILDMAGGSGCFTTALADRLPFHIRLTLADLPGVVDRFQKQQPLHGRHRIHAVPADLFDASTWPIGPDCHLLANVVHDWGPSQVGQIFTHSHHALSQSNNNDNNNNKCLVVIEQLLAVDQTGPLPAALASVSMLLGDWRTGKQYSFGELRGLLHQAGFARVEMGPKCGEFHRAILAYV